MLDTSLSVLCCEDDGRRWERKGSHDGAVQALALFTAEAAGQR